MAPSATCCFHDSAVGVLMRAMEAFSPSFPLLYASRTTLSTSAALSSMLLTSFMRRRTGSWPFCKSTSSHVNVSSRPSSISR